MNTQIDALFAGDPSEWLSCLPNYIKPSVEELLRQGKSFTDAAQVLLAARAEHTHPFGAPSPQKDGNLFLQNLVQEIENFLCGDSRYESERTKLFGESGLVKTYVVSAISVAIAPALGVSAVVLSPAIALILASFGKITISAWCASRKQAKQNATS